MTDEELAIVVRARNDAVVYVSCLRESADQLASDRARVAFWEVVRDAAAALLPEPEPRPRAAAPKRTDVTPPADPECDRAREIGEELLELLDDLPDAAADFVDSVRECAEGILETIADTGDVSERQFAALQNMLDGAKRWMR